MRKDQKDQLPKHGILAPPPAPIGGCRRFDQSVGRERRFVERWFWATPLRDGLSWALDFQMTRWKKLYFDFVLPRVWTVPQRVAVVIVADAVVVDAVVVVVIAVAAVAPRQAADGDELTRGMLRHYGWMTEAHRNTGESSRRGNWGPEAS